MSAGVSDSDDEIVLALVIAGVVELAIPDTWVEVDHDDQGVRGDLAWPLILTLGRIGEFDEDASLVGYARAVAEPHIDTQVGEARGVFTGRIDVLTPLDGFGFGVGVEGGYQVGDGGTGLVVGGGLIVSIAGVANYVLGYRAALVGPLQHRATLQLEIPLPMHWLYQSTEL